MAVLLLDRRLQRAQRRAEEARLLVRGPRLPPFQLHRAAAGPSGQPQDGRAQWMRAEGVVQYAGGGRFGR